MAENMNGLGSKTKYEYHMAKARDEVKSIFDFFWCSMKHFIHRHDKMLIVKY